MRFSTGQGAHDHALSRKWGASCLHWNLNGVGVNIFLFYMHFIKRDSRLELVVLHLLATELLNTGHWFYPWLYALLKIPLSHWTLLFPLLLAKVLNLFCHTFITLVMSISVTFSSMNIYLIYNIREKNKTVTFGDNWIYPLMSVYHNKRQVFISIVLHILCHDWN
jgi:hypothetical protein